MTILEFAVNHRVAVTLLRCDTVGERAYYRCQLTRPGPIVPRTMTYYYLTDSDQPPTLEQVLEVIRSEIEGTDLPFPEWAHEHGFNSCSTTIERMYQECVVTSRAFHRFLGPDVYRDFALCEVS